MTFVGFSQQEQKTGFHLLAKCLPGVCLLASQEFYTKNTAGPCFFHGAVPRLKSDSASKVMTGGTAFQCVLCYEDISKSF